MLTSVDQVRENTGVALVLVSTNAVVKRAAIARPSVEATARNSDTVKSQDTAAVKKATAARNPTTGTRVEDIASSSLSTVLTLFSSGGYGRQEESGYGRQEYVGDSYSQGYGQQGYAREESSRYGADPYSSGGYGRQEGNEYGGERPERGYGASGVPGGFGEEEEYGQRRQEYGSGGYGGSGGYDDEGYQRRY